MGGCIGIYRNEGDTINGSTTNVSRPASGKNYSKNLRFTLFSRLRSFYEKKCVFSF